MTSNISTQKSKITRLDRILILSGIIAPFILLFAILISGAFHPGYSHISQAVSELGAQGVRFKAIINYAGLVPTGLLTLAFSLAMFRYRKIEPAILVSSYFVAIIGMGRLLAGFFPCDPNCFPIVSLSGRLHAISGFTALFAGALAPLAMAFSLRHRERKILFYLSLFLGLVALVMFFALISQLWMLYFGGIQRILLIISYIWIIVIAVSMFRENN